MRGSLAPPTQATHATTMMSSWVPPSRRLCVLTELALCYSLHGQKKHLPMSMQLNGTSVSSHILHHSMGLSLHHKGQESSPAHHQNRRDHHRHQTPQTVGHLPVTASLPLCPQEYATGYLRARTTGMKNSFLHRAVAFLNSTLLQH